MFEKVKSILIEQLGVEENQITMDASLKYDLNADSLDMIELVMALEEELGSEISDADIENIKTVGDVVRYLEENK